GVATKATQLEAALFSASPEAVGDALVIPLLNGIDHVELLRSHYPKVAAGAIRAESELVSPGHVLQSSPFLRVELAEAEQVVEELRRAGIDARTRGDEKTLLWEKLAMLAPVALATTAHAAPLGIVLGDERFAGCREE